MILTSLEEVFLFKHKFWEQGTEVSVNSGLHQSDRGMRSLSSFLCTREAEKYRVVPYIIALIKSLQKLINLYSIIYLKQNCSLFYFIIGLPRYQPYEVVELLFVMNFFLPD